MCNAKGTDSNTSLRPVVSHILLDPLSQPLPPKGLAVELDEAPKRPPPDEAPRVKHVQCQRHRQQDFSLSQILLDPLSQPLPPKGLAVELDEATKRPPPDEAPRVKHVPKAATTRLLSALLFLTYS